MKKLKKYKKVSKPVIVKFDTKSKPLSIKVEKKEKPKRPKTVKIKDEAEKIIEESGVYKTPEFLSYVVWKSLPAMLRGENVLTLSKFGIDDELSISLLEIKNQTKFAERFGIKRATCSEWNKILIDKNLINENILRWAKMITPNVIMALGKTAVKTGKAPEVLAWEKVVEGYEEKSNFSASPELVDILKLVREIISGEKPKDKK